MGKVCKKQTKNREWISCSFEMNGEKCGRTEGDKLRYNITSVGETGAKWALQENNVARTLLNACQETRQCLNAESSSNYL